MTLTQKTSQPVFHTNNDTHTHTAPSQTQQWTDAYHDGTFLSYSGAIRAALILDLFPPPPPPSTTSARSDPAGVRLLTIGACVSGLICFVCVVMGWVGGFCLGAPVPPWLFFSCLFPLGRPTNKQTNLAVLFSQHKTKTGTRGQQPNLDLVHLAITFLSPSNGFGSGIEVELDWCACINNGIRRISDHRIDVCTCAIETHMSHTHRHTHRHTQTHTNTQSHSHTHTHTQG